MPTDLATPLLPRLADVEAALEANGRERKRLFTLRKLVEQSLEDAADVADAAREPAKAAAK